MADLTKACLHANGLSKRDLEIGSALGGKYTVTVHQTKEGLWTVSVQFEGKIEAHSIETARGGMKVWRNMISAISFVQETCKLASEVFIEVGDWKLCRMNGHLGRQ